MSEQYPDLYVPENLFKWADKGKACAATTIQIDGDTRYIHESKLSSLQQREYENNALLRDNEIVIKQLQSRIAKMVELAHKAMEYYGNDRYLDKIITMGEGK